MIIPKYWAEARLQENAGGRRVTVRRFGWSDDSQQTAQLHAEARARDAITRIQAGEHLRKREKKAPYNSPDGLPIREEIVSRHDETIITRNSYGARCLNHPDVLFGDIDCVEKPSSPNAAFMLFAGAVGIAAAYWRHSTVTPSNYFMFGLVVAFATFFVIVAIQIFRLRTRGTPKKLEQEAKNRIEAFITAHPDWHLRVYSTPAGFRLLAMHRRFPPGDPAIAECFEALQVDPLFSRLCHDQKCFRARVSPKPYRMKMKNPRIARIVWPVSQSDEPRRNAWIETYEKKAQDFSACRYVEDIGSPVVDPVALSVQKLHDELCGAMGNLPLA